MWSLRLDEPGYFSPSRTTKPRVTSQLPAGRGTSIALAVECAPSSSARAAVRVASCKAVAATAWIKRRRNVLGVDMAILLISCDRYGECGPKFMVGNSENRGET